MKIKKYLFIVLSILYLEILFHFVTYSDYDLVTFINIGFISIIFGTFLHVLTNVFPRRVNIILCNFMYFILCFWYGLYHVFYKVFVTPFSLALFKIGDQLNSFKGYVLDAIINNIFVIILLFIPFILILILSICKKIDYERINLRNFGIYLFIFCLSILVYMLCIRHISTLKELYYESDNNSLCIEKLGVLNATYIDVKSLIFGYDEDVEKVYNIEEKNDDDKKTNVEKVYSYNYEDHNFDGGSGEIAKINEYMKNDLGTKQNDYTGMFKGKNLIYIVAESFSEIGVSEKYTPTLYKMIHEGFYFKNFYTSTNLSTIGGEYQALTGLYADNSILATWRKGGNYFPYGIATKFQNENYNTFAYHDNSAYFQNRNVYLKSQGFTNFKACYNGLEKSINCKMWPQSDLQMMKATIKDFINSDKPFMTYYMTVSGHFAYTFSGNSIASKNKKLVSDLDAPEGAKAYVATQIELDKALEELLKELEDAGKLDDTVIVLQADHYPYNLSLDNINKLSSYKRDEIIEANSNNLIIYNSATPSVEVDKVGMAIDVLPTIYNMFGINYDSRLIIGKDIMSTTEGIAFFKDKSWVTNKGTYYAASKKFVPTGDEVSQDYIDNINNIVKNRIYISKLITKNNYYKYIFDK